MTMTGHSRFPADKDVDPCISTQFAMDHRVTGDGIDWGVSTGERFGRFVYWLVVRYSADSFTDDSLMQILRAEFPNRPGAGGQRTFQKISAYRSYAKKSQSRLGIKNDAQAAEVLARLNRRMPAA